MVKSKYNLDKIKQYYNDEKLTASEIGKLVGCSGSTIRRLLIKNGVSMRRRGNIEGKEYCITSPFKQEVKDVEALIEFFNKCLTIKQIAETMGVCAKAVKRKIDELKLIRPKSMKSRIQYDPSNDREIIRLYNEGLSSTEIGKKIGITHKTVLSHLLHNGIKIRSLSESHFAKNQKKYPDTLNDYESLYDMYISRKMSKKDIGKALNVAPHVIDRCLKMFGIPIRGSSECKIGLCLGEKHPNWKGGRTGLYARLREHFRNSQTKQIIKRDGHKCQLCGSKNNLQVHHIIHFKDIFNEILSEHPEMKLKENENELYNIMINDKRFNNLSNLITYCKKCHLSIIHGYKKKINNIMNYRLYKFGAPWCGQCKVLSDRLNAVSLDNCKIIEFDVDKVEEEMIDEFQIRNIPVTFLIDENDNIVKKWVGIFDVNEIEKLVTEKSND